MRAQWRDYSEIYRILLDPSHEPDADIARQLAYVSTFGSAMYPLVMRAYRDHRAGAIDNAELIQTLEHVQALLLRRRRSSASATSGSSRGCAGARDGAESLVAASRGSRRRTSASAWR